MATRTTWIAIAALLGSTVAGCSLTTHFDDFRPGDGDDAGTDSGGRDAGPPRDAQGDDAQPDDDAEIDAPMNDAEMFDAPMIDGGPGGVLLDVMIEGDGAGSVSSDDTLITCPSGACSNAYDPTDATVVMLTAVAEAGTSDFTGWGGACSGTDPVCMVTMDMARSVTATFTRRHYAVTVTLSGDGAGTVTDGPGSITCDGSASGVCTVDYAAGSTVMLSATAGPASTFGGWSGPCTGTGACSFTILEDTTVGASFDRDRRSLNVMLGGTGTGSVTSAPAGIDCGTTCSASYVDGTMVTLTAAAASDSTFMGWTGGGCSGTGTCVVTMDMARMVTATFNLRRYTLTVNKAGTGTGTVISTTPLGLINCGGTCSTMQSHGFAILLSAMPGAGSTFTGWSGGGCDPLTPTCLISLTSDTTVTANFALQTRDLTVAFAAAGDGTGTVTSSPSGISCTTGSGTGCGAPFDFGSMVTVTASPGVGSAFVQWSSGGCSGTSAMCTVTMDMARTVTAELRRNRYTVTVTKNGAGSGTVSGSGISCGGTCSAMIAHGDSVMLTAAADAGSTFGGWGGACASAGSSPTCTVPITAVSSVIATFTLGTSVLTVTRNGNGRVVSAPAGIDCQTTGGTCAASFTSGTMITLTPTADTGYMFTGWGGACSGSGGCSVTMGPVPIGVTANFAPIQHMLSVTRAGPGTGGGLVTSAPSGINCGATCSATYSFGTMVTLTAGSSDGSAIFTGWSGAGVPASCAAPSTAPCTVTMDMARAITANFNLRTYPLDVVREGGGTGGVSSSPPGIACSGTTPDCSETYMHGQTVTLTASAASGSNFAGWTSGPCSGSLAAMCAVPMTMAQTVRARFDLNRYTLTVNRTGMGSVISGDMMISCGTTCSAQYDHGSSVTLTATTAIGWRFAGWGGGVCSGTGPCVVSMTMARTVTATFLQQVTLTIEPGDIGGIPVISGDGFINCQGDRSRTGCSRTYDAGTTVQLIHQERPWFTFGSWNVASCTGTGPCVITVSATMTISPTFNMLGNLAFVTNRTYDGALGGLAGADARCEGAAQDGQLPPVAYVAYLSEGGSPLDRIDSVDGWVRPDGFPVAYDQRELTQGGIRHVMMIDEYGTSISASPTVQAWTGSNYDGTASTDNCSGWTASTSARTGMTGHALRGGGNWADHVAMGCNTEQHLYCFAIDRTYPPRTPTAPPATAGYVFVSRNAYTGSATVATMDAGCRTDAMNAGFPSSSSYVAYVGTPSTPAAMRVSFAGPFYRADGWLVGDRNNLVSGLGRLSAPITYLSDATAYGSAPGSMPLFVWTGQVGTSPSSPPSNMQSCTGWTSSSLSAFGIGGDPAGTSWDRWGNVNMGLPCAASRRVYCIRGS